MKYYYANSANQPAGPVTLDELNQLLARGEITPATHIIPVGETVWRPLSTILPAPSASTSPASALASSAPPPTAQPLTPHSPPSPNSPPTSVPAPASASPAFKPADATKLPTILSSFIGILIGKARTLLSIPRLTALFTAAGSFGQLIVLAGALLALIYGIVYAIKYDSFEIFLYGLASVLILAVLQFVARRLLDACASILKTSPTRVASVAVLECLGLVLLLAALGALVSGIIAAIQIESFTPLIPALVSFIVLTAFAGVALHPSLANVEEAPATAGEEAIGLFSFFAKAGLALQPLLFAVYATTGAIVILFALFGRDISFALGGLLLPPIDISFSGGGSIGAAIIATACLLPLMTYLSFLLYYLLIDVLRAILSIPGKLDQLRR